jgi:uncharacterized membrane protein YgdD (TMEM256/DUF423 family)
MLLVSFFDCSEPLGAEILFSRCFYQYYLYHTVLITALSPMIRGVVLLLGFLWVIIGQHRPESVS